VAATGPARPHLMVATGNPRKVRQIAELAGDLAAVTPVPRGAAESLMNEPSEGSFQSIAEAKALAASRYLPGDTLVVATDGGLLIPALAGSWNPLRTHRFAGEEVPARERAERLLSLAAALRGDERRIGWREAMAVARGGRLLATWVADSPPGVLATELAPAALSAGEEFWVPALWRCPDCGGKRLADLTPAERAARRDHWAQLGERLRAFLLER